jgi:UDP-glucuronate 4-epimerase
MAPFKFIDRVSTETAIQQYGDGSTSRDYTYITDIVDGVVAAIDRPLGYEVINLGNGRPFQLRSFISLVEACVGKKAVTELLPLQPGDVDHTCACIDKAQRLLDYAPKVTFEEGILRTTEWYLQASKEGLFGCTAARAARLNENTGMKRNLSDLELSSLVTKSAKRVTKRTRRFSDDDEDSNFVIT